MRFVAAWIGLLILVPGLALGSPGFRLETYGDSLTAGFLSNTSLMTPPPLKDISKIISDLAMFKLTDLVQYIEPHQSRTLAWPSQLAEILRKDGSRVEVENRAVSGSTSADLQSQLVPTGTDVRALFFSGITTFARIRSRLILWWKNSPRTWMPPLPGGTRLTSTRKATSSR